MKDMPHILSVSYDAVLLRTRQLMLESRGYKVTSAEGYIEATRKCRESRYDLLIIGHSIPHPDKEALVAEIGQYCKCPVLALLRLDEVNVAGAAATVDPSQPADLLNAVVKLLG